MHFRIKKKLNIYNLFAFLNYCLIFYVCYNQDIGNKKYCELTKYYLTLHAANKYSKQMINIT